MPRLSTVLAAAGTGLPAGGPDPEVVDVVQDSRAARPGALFVAIPGAHTDGHAHAAAAVAAGAVAVVAERALPEVGDRVPVVLVASARAVLGALAAGAHRQPGRTLTVAGVTGTDGKTTTTTLLHAAWTGAGIAAAALTTVDMRVGTAVEPNRSRQTTLEADELQRQLRRVADAGCTHVALETSSHALVLHRVDAIPFRLAVVLAITSEHLDIHGSVEAYIAAKARLVEMVAARPDGIVVHDADDPVGRPALERIRVPRRLLVSLAGDPGADLIADAVEAGPEGVRFTARTPWGARRIGLRLAGRFNAGNALAALGAACALGADLDGAVAGLAGLRRVSGRMERVETDAPFAVVIDYAHTAAALERVLTELRAATPGRLIVVVGSAGDRDRPKRPAMGAVAARLADLVVLTDEDPRDEDRLAILEEIAAGARTAGAGPERLRLVPDRAEAIAAAVAAAGPGDTVLCAGKGHETSLIGPGGPAPWDERAAVTAALRRRAG